MPSPRDMQNLLSSSGESSSPAVSDSTEAAVTTRRSPARRCGVVTLVLLLLSIFLGAVATLVSLLVIIGGQPPTVNTDCGFIQGTYDMQKNVFVFNGIPYAEAPTGSNRWQPPVALSHYNNNCWVGIKKAQVPRPPCAQYSDGSMFGMSAGFVGSEDCLYVDVMTPSTDLYSNLPVVVWLHGLYLTAGAPHVPGYAPTESLAKELDVVFVSVQYRLSAFGFLTLNELQNHTGNYGVLDQMQALRWVKANIHNFGGDPGKVTVIGHGSGASCIYLMLASPQAEGLFHRAVVSGASSSFNHTKSDAEDLNSAFYLRQTGCDLTHSDCGGLDVNECRRDCLYNLNASEVARAVVDKWDPSEGNDLPTNGSFPIPLLVVDGDVFPKSPLDALVDNSALDVPLLIGTTAQEVDFNPAPGDLNRWTEATFNQSVARRFEPFGDNITEDILAMYPYSNGELTFTSLASDIRATCPQQYIATMAAKSQRKSKVYHYIIASRPSQPVNAFDIVKPARYSFHGWEMFAFFKNIGYYMKQGQPNDNDKKFANTFQENVMEFVRSGKVKERDWKRMPSHTVLISNDIKNVTADVQKKCDYLMENGFFEYAWMN